MKCCIGGVWNDSKLGYDEENKRKLANMIEIAIELFREKKGLNSRVR